MTETTTQSPGDPLAWSKNLAEIAERSQRLVSEFLARQAANGTGKAGAKGGMGPIDPLNVGNAFLEMTRQMMRHPERVVEAQISLWQDYMRLWQSTAERFLGGNPPPVAEAAKSDHRFKDPAWQDSALFDFIKQSYLLTARWLQATVKQVDGLDDKTVQKMPLLVMPPWINKFYILDLRPKNSFVKWAVEQGHSVFVVSWVNPDETLAGKDFADYMRLGPLAALDAIAQATGERDVNVVGYCLGGTLLAATLAYM